MQQPLNDKGVGKRGHIMLLIPTMELVSAKSKTSNDLQVD
jgi:hypothetical protein